MLHEFPDRVKRVLEQRRGSQEAVRAEFAHLTRRLWKHKAMKFTEHARVESVTKAVITLTMPDVSLAKLDFRREPLSTNPTTKGSGLPLAVAGVENAAEVGLAPWFPRLQFPESPGRLGGVIGLLAHRPQSVKHEARQE